ncbi:MAG: PAS domain S-box protein [Elusimicrobiota bacterium]
MKLQNQMLVLLLPFATLSTIGVLYLTEKTVRQIMTDKAVSSKMAEVKEQTAALSNAFQTRGETAFLSILRSLADRDNMPYAFVLDPDGRVLAHTNVMERGRIYRDPFTRAALQTSHPQSQPGTYQGRRIVEVFYPIWYSEVEKQSDSVFWGEPQPNSRQRRLGTLRLALPLENILRTARQISQTVGVILLGFAGLMVSFILLGLHRLFAPIHQLLLATDRMRHGELGINVPEGSSDELGNLSRSFNEMSRDLAKTTVSKDFVMGVVTQMPDALVVIDSASLIRMVNRSTCDLLGYTDEDLLGRSVTELQGEASSERWIAGVEQILKGTPLVNQETVLSNHQKEKIPVLLSGSDFRNPDGTPAGAILVAKDLRERQWAEAALKESEERFQQVVENAGEWVWETDAKGLCTYASPIIEKVLGYSLDEVIGKKHFFDFFSPTERDALRQGALKAFSQKSPANRFVSCYLHKDGSVRWISASGTPILSVQGSLLGYRGVNQDITEIQKAEEAIRDAKVLYESILNAIPVATFVTDNEGRLLIWNRTAEEFTGLKAADMLGKGNYEYSLPFYGQRRPILIDRVLHPSEKIQESYVQFSMEGETVVGETFVHNARRGEAYVVAVAAPLYNSKGQRIGAIESVHDITERKMMEKELKKANVMALEMVRFKSEFTANMSHEIRTPMNTVIGMTELLLQTPLTLDQQTYTNTLLSSANQLLELINDVLDFSKIESGNLILETIDFNLHGMIDNVFAVLSYPAYTKGLELIVEIPDDIPRHLRGDPGRIRQVVTNLLGNAVKFTQKGEVFFRIFKETETEASLSLCFIVTDTGIGINPEHQQQLFHPFTQADSSITRKFGGTGLGLAISKQVVELMGGAIGFQSTPGHGSTFWFRVQLQKGSETTSEASFDVNAFKGMSVLIVSPADNLRRILRQQLIDWGLKSDAVKDSREALAWLRLGLFEGTPWNVVLLDHGTPDFDGLSLLDHLRQDSRLAATRVVLLSPPNHRLDFDEMRRRGLESCVYKPILKTHLYEGLVAALSFDPGHVPPAPSKHFAPGTPEVLIPITASKGETHPVQILVVEDNAANQVLFSCQLKNLGFRADIVSDGHQALEAMAKHPYDLVLMDCQMPGLNGYQTTAEIRRRETAQGRHTPIVAITANALGGEEQNCRQVGMDDYLAKPVRFNDLKELVKRWLSPDRSCKQDKITEEPPEKWVDLADLLESMGNNPAELQTLFRIFWDEITERLQGLESTLRSADATAAAAVAHGLIGTSASYGVSAVVPLLRGIEKRAKAKDLTGSDALLVEIRAQFKRAQEYMDDYFRNMGTRKT